MKVDERRGPKRLRVLVALDSAEPSEDCLRAVSNLLDADRLEVTGLYVEDEEVLRAARLPGLREITLSGQETALDPIRIGRDMARQAAQARRAFDTIADRLTREHARFHHRFLVARGRVVEEVGRAAAESDFVMVTRALRAVGLRPRLGRSFAHLLKQPKDVLFINVPWGSGSSVVVLNDSGLALDYGERLARAQGLSLVIATPAGTTPARLPEGARLRQVPRLEEEAIAELCLREDARLLVLLETPELDWTELLISLMDRLPCSLLKLARP